MGAYSGQGLPLCARRGIALHNNPLANPEIMEAPPLGEEHRHKRSNMWGKWDGSLKMFNKNVEEQEEEYVKNLLAHRKMRQRKPAP